MTKSTLEVKDFRAKFRGSKWGIVCTHENFEMTQRQAFTDKEWAKMLDDYGVENFEDTLDFKYLVFNDEFEIYWLVNSVEEAFSVVECDIERRKKEDQNENPEITEILSKKIETVHFSFSSGNSFFYDVNFITLIQVQEINLELRKHGYKIGCFMGTKGPLMTITLWSKN